MNFRTIAESARVYSFLRLSPPCPRFTRLERAQARKTLHPSRATLCTAWFILSAMNDGPVRILLHVQVGIFEVFIFVFAEQRASLFVQF